MIFKGDNAIFPMRYVNPSGVNNFDLRWVPHECYKHFPTRSTSESKRLFASIHAQFATKTTASYASIPGWIEPGNDFSYPIPGYPSASGITRYEYEKVTGGWYEDYLRWFKPTNFEPGNAATKYFLRSGYNWASVNITSPSVTDDSISSYESGGSGWNPQGSPAIYTGHTYSIPFSGSFLPPIGSNKSVEFKPYAILCLKDWSATDTQWGMGFFAMTVANNKYTRWHVDDGTSWNVTRSGATFGTRISTGYVCDSKVVRSWSYSGSTYKIVAVKPKPTVQWTQPSALQYYSLPFLSRRGSVAADACCAVMAIGCEYLEVT